MPFLAEVSADALSGAALSVRAASRSDPLRRSRVAPHVARHGSRLIVVAHWCNTFLEGKPVVPTAKKRINITVDDEVYEALERLSGKRDQSIAGVGLGLIEAALEYQEDLYFSRVADERLSRKDRRIAHDKAWD